MCMTRSFMASLSIKFKAIKPDKKLVSAKEFNTVFEAAALKTANLTKRDLESTVRTWRHKPTFTVEVIRLRNSVVIVAGTDDPIYGYVDQGTRPHIIRPRRSRYLRFQVGGRPKTRAGVIGSQAGSAGDSWRTEFFVLHPGTAKRDFTGKIAERRQKTIEQETAQRLAKVLRD